MVPQIAPHEVVPRAHIHHFFFFWSSFLHDGCLIKIKLFNSAISEAYVLLFLWSTYTALQSDSHHVPTHGWEQSDFGGHLRLLYKDQLRLFQIQLRRRGDPPRHTPDFFFFLDFHLTFGTWVADPFWVAYPLNCIMLDFILFVSIHHYIFFNIGEPSVPYLFRVLDLGVPSLVRVTEQPMQKLNQLEYTTVCTHISLKRRRIGFLFCLCFWT